MNNTYKWDDDIRKLPSICAFREKCFYFYYLCKLEIASLIPFVYSCMLNYPPILRRLWFYTLYKIEKQPIIILGMTLFTSSIYMLCMNFPSNRSALQFCRLQWILVCLFCNVPYVYEYARMCTNSALWLFQKQNRVPFGPALVQNLYIHAHTRTRTE